MRGTPKKTGRKTAKNPGKIAKASVGKTERVGATAKGQFSLTIPRSMHAKLTQKASALGFGDNVELYCRNIIASDLRVFNA